VAVTLNVAACDRNQRADDELSVPDALISRKATRSAFDLVVVGSGAALLWVGPKGDLAMLELDAAGEPRGGDRVIRKAPSATEISEVVASAEGRTLTAAWVESSGSNARVLGQVIEVGGVTGELLDLGAITLHTVGSRGNVAIAANQGAALVMARGTDTDCASSASGRCAEFRFFYVDRDGARPTGLPAAVNEPCPIQGALLAITGNRRFYGVCNKSGDLWSTTVFMIQYEPEYARADKVLAGCVPQQLSTLGRDAVVVGECGIRRRAARLTGADEPIAEVDLREVTLRCESKGPSIAVPASQPWVLALDRPRDDLGALLPAKLAERGSRALWTGKTLLVARERNGLIELFGHRCRDQKLEAIRTARP
jgi:hypothetical protein